MAQLCLESIKILVSSRWRMSTINSINVGYNNPGLISGAIHSNSLLANSCFFSPLFSVLPFRAALSSPYRYSIRCSLLNMRIIIAPLSRVRTIPLIRIILLGCNDHSLSGTLWYHCSTTTAVQATTLEPPELASCILIKQISSFY